MSKAYGRTWWRGHQFDNRTVSALLWAEGRFLREDKRRKPWPIGQGSYADGTLSAGTHSKGGAVDIGFAGMSKDDRAATVKWLRRAGFEGAWAREGPAWGTNNDHCHAILDGPTISPQAKAQVASYRAHRNGLANNAWDTTPRPRIRRRWNHRLRRPVLHPLPGQKLTPAQRKLLPEPKRK